MGNNRAPKKSVFSDSGESDKYITETCFNVKTAEIHITEDKLRNILIDYVEKVKKTKTWQMPFSYATTLAIAILTTSDYKNFFNIQTETVFIVGLIVSIAFLIINIGKSVSSYRQTGMDKLIRKIKNEMIQKPVIKKRKMKVRSNFNLIEQLKRKLKLITIQK